MSKINSNDNLYSKKEIERIKSLSYLVFCYYVDSVDRVDYNKKIKYLSDKTHLQVSYLCSLKDFYFERYATSDEKTAYKLKMQSESVPNYVIFCDKLFSLKPSERINFIISSKISLSDLKSYFGSYKKNNINESEGLDLLIKEYEEYLNYSKNRIKEEKKIISFNEACAFYQNIIDLGFYSIKSYAEYCGKNKEKILYNHKKYRNSIKCVDISVYDRYLELLEVNRKKTFLFIRDKVDKFNSDLKNCFFDYSLISCKYIEGENLEVYKKRKMSCNNMNRKMLYHEDEDLKNAENIYFFDSIDYTIFDSKKNNGKIIENNENFSFIVSEVFYNENKLKQFEKDISYDELNKKESDGIFAIKIKRDNKKEVNDIFGNKYVISQKYQILPIYKFSLKRNEYYVLHVDPEFKRKKEFLIKLNSIQKDQSLLNMNIYLESSIEESLKFLLKRRYNKVILISSIGKDKSGFRFVEIARKILFNFDVLVLFFSEDEKPIPEIGKFKNCLFANKLDLYKEYISNYNYEGLINLKKKLEDLYNITFQQFSFDFLSFTNAQNRGEFNSLESFRSIYFREVYIKNDENYIYMDGKGKTQITKIIDKSKLWYVTLSGDNEITFFSNGFYAFILVYIVFLFLDAGRSFSKWDDLMHWGKMVKEMFRIDRFYSESNLLQIHKDYPPFMQLFEYVWCRFGGGTESLKQLFLRIFLRLVP